jgi:hypothetical protein
MPESYKIGCPTTKSRRLKKSKEERIGARACAPKKSGAAFGFWATPENVPVEKCLCYVLNERENNIE